MKDDLIILKSFDKTLGKNILDYLDLGDMFVFIFSDYSVIGFIQYYHSSEDKGFEVISEFDLVESENIEKRISQLKNKE